MQPRGEGREGVFFNVEEGSSRATISRMLRHQVPPKDCSNVQDPWNSTKAGVLRCGKFRGCLCVSSAVLKSPQCFVHGPISKIFGGNRTPFKAGPHIWHTPAHLLACSTILHFPRLGRILASLTQGPDSEDMSSAQGSVLDIEKHPGTAAFLRPFCMPWLGIGSTWGRGCTWGRGGERHTQTKQMVLWFNSPHLRGISWIDKRVTQGCRWECVLLEIQNQVNPSLFSTLSHSFLHSLSAYLSFSF